MKSLKSFIIRKRKEESNLKIIIGKKTYETKNKEKEQQIKNESLQIVRDIFQKAESIDDEEYLIMMLVELRSLTEMTLTSLVERIGCSELIKHMSVVEKNISKFSE